MKNLLILSIVMFSSLTSAQSRKAELIKILDTVISRSKEISLYAQSVNWDSLSTQMYASVESPETIEDLKPAFELLLNGLRDHHGTIRKLSDYSIIASFTDHKNSRKTDTRTFNTATWKIVNNVDARFEYAMLPGNIAYLKIVGVGPNVDGQKEAERIRSALREFSDLKVTKWIVDLRYNGGGNINVMLAGIAPLFNTETIVGIKDQNGDISITANIRKGDFWYAGVKAFAMNHEPKTHDPKIAVLTSRWTWSSGEFVAVAFKGQKNTRFFGEKTGGYTTNNSWEIVNNEIALVMSTGIYCDRNDKEYEKYVEPDVEIAFEVETNKEKDTGIISAVKWLKE